MCNAYNTLMLWAPAIDPEGIPLPAGGVCVLKREGRFIYHLITKAKYFHNQARTGTQWVCNTLVGLLWR